jgi:hypothetical protein
VQKINKGVHETAHLKIPPATWQALEKAGKLYCGAAATRKEFSFVFLWRVLLLESGVAGGMIPEWQSMAL